MAFVNVKEASIFWNVCPDRLGAMQKSESANAIHEANRKVESKQMPLARPLRRKEFTTEFTIRHVTPGRGATTMQNGDKNR